MNIDEIKFHTEKRSLQNIDIILCGMISMASMEGENCVDPNCAKVF